MAEKAEIIVDTNVIFDILHEDPTWADWSRKQLETHAGQLAINPLVYSELCYHATSQNEVDQLVRSFGFAYRELPQKALYLAAKAFQEYRRHGGTKTAPLADFFIGAHAQASGMPILTRDESRYKTYFPAVALISP